MLFSDNPVVETLGDDYRIEILCLLPHVRKLDKVTVAAEEQEAAKERVKERAEAAAAAEAEKTATD